MHYLVYNFALICVIASVRAEEAPVDSASEARKHYSWAVQYERGSLWKDALVQYGKAVALDPNNARYYCALGKLLYRLKRVPEAKVAFLRAVDADSSYIQAYYGLARIYHSDAKYDSVMILYRKILELDPARKEVRRRLAELYRYKGMATEALREFELLLKGDPEDEELLSSVGALRVELGHFCEALEVYERLLRLRPGGKKLRSIVGGLREKVGNYAGALKLYRALAEEDSSDYTALSKVLALSQRLGRREDVIWALEGLLRLRPGEVDLMAKLAEAYLDRERLEEARALLDEGLKLAPEDGFLRTLSGEYYWRKGERERALKEFNKVLGDPKWEGYARRMMATIRAEIAQEKLKREEEKEREFFRRGRQGS